MTGPVGTAATVPDLTVRTAALAYAERGWKTTPLNGKRPILPNWPHRPPPTPTEIAEWYERWPAAGVGIVTGPGSGLAVLDLDWHSGGPASLAALENIVGLLPRTLVVLTGNYGVHLYYAHPGRKVTSAVAALGRGLDIRADGAQVVAPPSVHPTTGQVYRWTRDGWFDYPLAGWPGAQLASVLRPVRAAAPFARPTRTAGTRPSGGLLPGLLRVVLDAAEGQRNDRLNWAAYRAGEHIRAGRLDPHQAVPALLAAGTHVGLPERECLATIGSALRTKVHQ